ncbi:MAG TPA: amidase [Candidatus Tectomicrobia bacterium]|nr:amidase [Candidatus Tectomicrobia bacterium]
MGEMAEEAGIAELQGQMASGQLTARQLVQLYLDRIEALDQRGPALRSMLWINPNALMVADELDHERRTKGPRGLLHGIPVLLKDNIDTVDMMTTAGSLALVGPCPAQDATVTKQLRQAGAIILGKANMSEWANFRSTRSSSGWSGVGRQGLNPYVLDRSPCGSSSGSAQAVAANLVTAALGTETNGSIVCPSSVCGVVGFKPTVGLTSRAGVIPISHTQDAVGPICRSVADAAAVLGALTGMDARDPASGASDGHVFADYTQFLDANGLERARIGVVRQYFGVNEHVDRIVEPLIDVMRGLGAVLVDPANFANFAAFPGAQHTVLEYEFKADLNRYLAERPDVPVHTLADLIAFNSAHAAQEMPYFLQERLISSQARGPLTDQAYVDALALDFRISRQEGIDEVMDRLGLDALFAPTRSPAWVIDLVNGGRGCIDSSTPAALAGYPLITVPAGYAFGALPVGVTFMGRRWSEPTLIKIAFAFEHATKARRSPQFIPTLRLA